MKPLEQQLYERGWSRTEEFIEMGTYKIYYYTKQEGREMQKLLYDEKHDRVIIEREKS